MNRQNELQKIARDYEKLSYFAGLVPKPAWKKYELAITKAYLTCMTAIKTDPKKKEKHFSELIALAKHSLLCAAKEKRDRLNEMLELLGEKKSIDTFSGQEYLEEDEEIDEAGDPDDRREEDEEPDEVEYSDGNEMAEDEEEPRPPQPVHVPAKPPVSSPMRNILKNMNIKGGAK